MPRRGTPFGLVLVDRSLAPTEAEWDNHPRHLLPTFSGARPTAMAGYASDSCEAVGRADKRLMIETGVVVSRPHSRYRPKVCSSPARDRVRRDRDAVCSRKAKLTRST